jgi:hypothetical protein
MCPISTPDEVCPGRSIVLISDIAKEAQKKAIRQLRPHAYIYSIPK